MAKWEEIQRDFSGGEVGARVIMREDAVFHGKALLEMQNYISTPQGTAVRTPGTRYIDDVDDLNARIIPFLGPDNSRSLVEITPGAIQIRQGLTDLLEPSILAGQIKAITPIYRSIKDNGFFNLGFEDWDATPLTGEYSIGWEEEQSAIIGTCQLYTQGNPDFLKLRGECTIPADTEYVQIDMLLQYVHNYSGPEATYTCIVKVGTSPESNDVWIMNFSDKTIGDYYDRQISVAKTLPAGTVLYLSLDVQATASTDNPYSSPVMRLARWRIFTQDTVDTGDGTVVGIPPWSAEELKDLQYIQSPYQGPVGGLGKELVFTHPSYPPYELVFLGAAWTLREKPFTNPPAAWSIGNYPSACTSFHGRLMLAGGQTNPVLGSSTGSATETVWGTEVTNWNLFSDPDDGTGVNPDDSIEFTSIYRSPIQWLYGQKSLLIGALEMEYIASADGVFQPADLGVFMHSTHGSSNVQPVGLGHLVLYPADGGTKVRGMDFENETQGWISPDLTVLHPDLFSQGIVRMVRMRNPFQMAVVVIANGQVALLHLDSTTGTQAWSRMNFNAQVRDVAVVAGNDGRDILFFTVERYNDLGEKVLSLEAVANWVEEVDWAYLNSHTPFSLDVASNVLTGLDHLDGKSVQVVGDGNYLGYFTVENGQVELIDQTNQPIEVYTAMVGLPIKAKMRTLPLIGPDPGGPKRYPKLYVRTLVGTRPIVNGERMPDRDPVTPQEYSQPVDLFYDHEALQMGWDSTQVITIEEDTPIRSEIVAIFGTVKGSSL